MSNRKLHIDFETRSVIDLKKSGLHVYVSHPSTDALCLGYAIDNGPVKLWKLGNPGPLDLMQAVHSGIMVCAHNANFEFMIWNFVCYKKYGWPSLKLNQLDCTMVRAYNMGLPGTLENASNAVGLNVKKDMAGHRIMLQLCKPRSFDNYEDPIWWDPKKPERRIDIPAKYERLYEYCKQDVEVERKLDRRLLALSEKERKIWHLDQKINYRGVYCDTKIVEKAIEIVSIEKRRLDKELREVTNNYVGTCNSSASLKDWINTFNIYGGEVYEKDGPMVNYKEDGQTKQRLQYKKGELKIVQAVDKEHVKDLLELDHLPEPVRAALEIRKEAAKSSTAKLKKMIEGASSDNRIRGCFQYYGAASTGRWAGRRIQLQNLKRPSIKQNEIEDIISLIGEQRPLRETIQMIDLFYSSPMSRISDCLRAMLKAGPGKKLIAVDFAAIEGRVLAWLAGQEDILNVFRSHGKIYEHTACQIYNLKNIDEVTKGQRLIGKVATLALGYQGGVKAFHSMGKNYLVKVEDSLAEKIKSQWRLKNHAIVSYWYALENAAISATKNEGQKFACGPKDRRVIFLKKGSFLFCKLPSERTICYPYPKMKLVDTPWNEKKVALTYKGEELYHFVTKVAYGGLLAENITQAVARDLLVDAMFRFEKAGYPIVMHVHDEIVSEVDKSFGSCQEAEKIMKIVPKWAKDLPIDVEGWEGERYRK